MVGQTCCHGIVRAMHMRRAVKITIFTYSGLHFCFLETPCDYDVMCCMDGKTVGCLPNPRSVPISIVSELYDVLCVSVKIAIFTTFLLLGDAIGAITQNVVWMESEFDAYKLCRCMYPSNYNSFRDIGNMRRVVLATA